MKAREAAVASASPPAMLNASPPAASKWEVLDEFDKEDERAHNSILQATSAPSQGLALVGPPTPQKPSTPTSDEMKRRLNFGDPPRWDEKWAPMPDIDDEDRLGHAMVGHELSPNQIIRIDNLMLPPIPRGPGTHQESSQLLASPHSPSVVSPS